MASPRPRKLPSRRPAPQRLTLGDVVGADVAAVLAARDRRAELIAMGFVPVQETP